MNVLIPVTLNLGVLRLKELDVTSGGEAAG